MALITQEVALKDVRFYSSIGYYEEEQILGNEFFVDLIVRFPFDNEDTEDLRNTVNYEELYQIMLEVMKPKRKLLESAAEEMLNRVRNKCSFAEEIKIVIRKTTPPFGVDHMKSVVSLYFKK